MLAWHEGYVRRLVLHFRELPLGAINQEAVDKARASIMRRDASGSARRRMVATLAAVLNHAAKRGWCEAPHFDLPPQSKRRVAFFMPD